MRALVVYESMFGNTHQVADSIAEGLDSVAEVAVTAVDGVSERDLEDLDLLVVGGPTHVHGMSRKTSRLSAVEMAKDDEDLTLDPDAEGESLREWFDDLDKGLSGRAAAFDTRVDVSPVLSGRASKGISHRLHRHGFDLIMRPESFLVDKENHLVPGEAERARDWGGQIGVLLAEAAEAGRL